MSLFFFRQKKTTEKFFALLFNSGVQALILYRLSHFFSKKRIFIKFRIHSFFYRLNQIFCNVDIDPFAKLGRNIWLPHPTGIVIGGTSIIGNNVVILQNVTLGAKKFDDKYERHPIIQDNVILCANAILLGKILIGKNAIIGAGSIVMKDVNEGEKVFGIHK